MRSLKTAVKIWKKEVEFKFITWGITPEYRANYRRMRQEAFRSTKSAMLNDLLNRHRIGDIIIFPEDLEKLQALRSVPIYRSIEEIYKKYL